MGSLCPYGYDLINGYMGMFPIFFESKYVICTGFYVSSEYVRSATVNIYDLVEVMLHYK